MATAQYDTRTRMVEETTVVLTLTEDEADALKEELAAISGSEIVRKVLGALRHPAPAADTFEHDGVVYDLNASYRDRDGDVWSFTGRVDALGTPRVTYTATEGSHATIIEVARLNGPLRKVTA